VPLSAARHTVAPRLSRAVPWAGALLALLIVAVIAWLGWTELREKTETQRARNELLVRVA